MWLVATTDVFDDWFAELGADAQVEVIGKVRLLKLLGSQLGRPHGQVIRSASSPDNYQANA